jgi:hypothetical protein
MDACQRPGTGAVCGRSHTLDRKRSVLDDVEAQGTTKKVIPLRPSFVCHVHPYDRMPSAMMRLDALKRFSLSLRYRFRHNQLVICLQRHSENSFRRFLL